MIKFIRWSKPIRYIRWFYMGGRRWDGKNGRHEDLNAFKKIFTVG